MKICFATDSSKSYILSVCPSGNMSLLIRRGKNIRMRQKECVTLLNATCLQDISVMNLDIYSLSSLLPDIFKLSSTGLTLEIILLYKILMFQSSSICSNRVIKMITIIANPYRALRDCSHCFRLTWINSFNPSSLWLGTIFTDYKTEAFYR